MISLAELIALKNEKEVLLRTIIEPWKFGDSVWHLPLLVYSPGRAMAVPIQVSTGIKRQLDLLLTLPQGSNYVIVVQKGAVGG